MKIDVPCATSTHTPSLAERIPPWLSLPLGSRSKRSMPMNELPKQLKGGVPLANGVALAKKLRLAQIDAPGASPPAGVAGPGAAD